MGPGQYPQCTRAPEREEAVVGSPNSTTETQETQHEMSPKNTRGGHRPDMVAEHGYATTEDHDPVS